MRLFYINYNLIDGKRSRNLIGGRSYGSSNAGLTAIRVNKMRGKLWQKIITPSVDGVFLPNGLKVTRKKGKRKSTSTDKKKVKN